MLGRESPRQYACAAVPTGGALLVGAAGVGKTRLAHAVADDLRAQGWRVVRAFPASGAAGIPLGAFAHLLPAAAPAGPDPVTAAELLRQAWTALRSADGDDRTVLVADDAHLLDPMSAALLYQLAATGFGRLLLTARAGEHLHHEVTALWKDELVARIDLAPLGREQVEALLDTALGGPASAQLLDRVWNLTRGNPLYLRELLLAAERAGRLHRRDGRWEWAGAPIADARLEDLIEDRLSALPDPVRAAVEVVAVAEPLELDLVAAVVPAPALADAQRHDALVVRGNPPVVQTAHPLHGEVLRLRLPAARRRHICRLLARGVDALGGPGSFTLRYVGWQLASGVQPPAEHLLDASRRARQRGDPALAERLARTALTGGGGTRARVALAEALYAAGRLGDGLAVLAEASPDGDDDVVQVTVLRVYLLFHIVADADRAHAALADGLAAVRDRSARAWLLALRASLHNCAGDPGAALRIVAPLLDQDDLSPRSHLAVLAGAAPALAFGGRFGQAVELCMRGQDAELVGYDEVPVAATWSQAALFFSALWSGALDAAADGVAELAGRQVSGPDQGAASGAAGAGWVALLRGHVTGAIDWFDRALAAAPPGHDQAGVRALAAGGLARACVLAGELDRAGRVLAEVETSAHPTVRWFWPLVELAHGRVLAAGGETGHAAQATTAVAARAHRHGHATFELLALHDLLADGSAAVAAALPRLQDLADVVEGGYVTAVHAQAAALRSPDPADLVHAAAAYEQLGMLGYAVDCLAEAARRYRSAGRTAPGAGAAERAQRLATRCPGLAVPRLEPLDLTAREREVAVLVARGLTNAAVADVLTVSVRTVDAHVAHIFTKLGLRSRAELAEVMAVAAPAAPARTAAPPE